MSSRWSRHSEYRNLELYPLWSVQLNTHFLHPQLTLPTHTHTQSQYHAVFESVLVYLDSFETYGNFQDL